MTMIMMIMWIKLIITTSLEAADLIEALNGKTVIRLLFQVFVTNATSAVNVVLKVYFKSIDFLNECFNIVCQGLKLSKGDVLLVTEHTYPACRFSYHVFMVMIMTIL